MRFVTGATTGILLMGICSGQAEDLIIQSFSSAGELIFNEVTDATEYRIEWSSSPSGSWTNFATAGAELDRISASGSGVVTRLVPMLYRVVATVASQAPAGMSLIPAGSFQMGNTYGSTVNPSLGYPSNVEPEELPVHTATTSAFYIDKFEVTNEKMRQILQYAFDNSFIGGTTNIVINLEGDVQILLNLGGSSELNFSAGVFSVDPGREDFPCIQISWFGAVAFCNYRSDMEGFSRPCNLTDWSLDQGMNGYRLPTEAEWEKAARGGLEGNNFPWPSLGGIDAWHIDGTRANYKQSGDPFEVGTKQTTPVGYYDGGQTPAGLDMANGYGLYDMAGNVWEWCHDYFGREWYKDPRASITNTPGPPWEETSTNIYFPHLYDPPWGQHAVRGASWNNIASDLRCSRRSRVGGFMPDNTRDDLGFRCVRNF